MAAMLSLFLSVPHTFDTMDYRKESNAFYNSPEWRKVREYVLMRDNFLCVQCGEPAHDVHHKRHLNSHNLYNTEISMNPDNLISLCKACHTRHHKQNCQVFDENGYLIER